jgi:hypothetical protein
MGITLARTGNGPTTRTSALQVRYVGANGERSTGRLQTRCADALPLASIQRDKGQRRDMGIGSSAASARLLPGRGRRCVGPETLGAAAKCDPRTLVNDLAERQAAYYKSLSDFPTFGRGWLNRTEARRNTALAMIGNATPRPA